MTRLLSTFLMAAAVFSVSVLSPHPSSALAESPQALAPVLAPAVEADEPAHDPADAAERAEAERVWAAYEQRWAETDSYAAQFTQVIELGGIDALVESAGRFYFAKPDLVRWEYTEGPPQEVVGDGAVMWVYQSDLEQVYKVDYATAFGEGGLVSLLAGRRGVSERYDARLGQGDAESVVISLTGRAGEGTIDVRVDHQTFDLREVVVVDAAGSVTRMTFDEVLRNSELDPALFSFTPPKGVDIIESPAARP